MSVKKINIKKLSGALCGVVLSAAVALTACSGGGAYKQGTPSFVESSSTVSASVSDASAAKGDTGAVNKNKNTESRSVGANASGVSSASVGTALKKPGGGSYFNGKGGRKPGKNADRKGHITLRVWDSNANTALARAAKDYEKIHPNVTIMVDNVSNPSPDSVKYAVSNETAADIIYIDQVYNASLGKEGYFADLTYFGANKVKDKFMASTVKSLSVGGALYGLPFDANTICFYYNKDIFKAAGAKPPKDLAGIKAAAKAINDKYNGNVEAYTLPFYSTGVNDNWRAFNFMFYLWRMGGDVLTPDLKKAAFNSSKGVAALETIIEFKKQGYTNGEYDEQSFIYGKSGMIDNGSWQLDNLFGKGKRANFGILPMPVLKKGVPGYSGLGLSGYGVTESSRNKQAAYDFVEFLCTGKAYQLEYCKAKKLIPSLKSAHSDSFYATDEWKVLIAQLDKSKFRPGVANWSRIETAISTAVWQAAKGDVTASDALNAAARVVDGLL